LPEAAPGLRDYVPIENRLYVDYAAIFSRLSEQFGYEYFSVVPMRDGADEGVRDW
jgi:hypothetical protein